MPKWFQIVYGFVFFITAGAAFFMTAKNPLGWEISPIPELVTVFVPSLFLWNVHRGASDRGQVSPRLRFYVYLVGFYLLLGVLYGALME